MEAAQARLNGTPPDMAEVRSGDGPAQLTAIPSPNEKGFFYPPLEDPVSTQIIEAVGKIAGLEAEVECTIEGPACDADAIDRIPLLIAGGYFGPETAYDDYRSELARRGKWAITWNTARSKGFWADLNLLNVRHPQVLASRTALGVVRASRERMGFKVFDGGAHSNGCQAMAELALHHPELFRTLTFKGGVGLDGEHNIFQMAPRLVNFLRKDVARRKVARLALRPKFLKEEAEYLAANIPLTLAEMYSAATCSLHDRIDTISELGIPIAGIQFQEDDFFPLEAVLHNSRHLFDVLHVYLDPDVRHTGPQEDPGGTASAQLEVLGELVELRQSRDSKKEPGMPLAA